MANSETPRPINSAKNPNDMSRQQPPPSIPSPPNNPYFISIMINPSDEVPDILDLTSLSLRSVPGPSDSIAVSNHLPFIPVDEWLNETTIAAAYQRFLRDLPFVHDALLLCNAFEHVVYTIRTVYSAAMMNTKMAEVLGNERIRHAEERCEERSRDNAKFIQAQHQAEVATIRAQHQAQVAAIQVQHQSELATTHAQHQADLKVMSVQHEADIAMSKTELQHQSEMLGAKLEMAEHRVVVLQDEIALARHKNFESTMLSVRSAVMGSISRNLNWKTAIAAGLDNQPLPTPAPEDCIVERQVRRVVGTVFASEPEMYAPVTKLFGRLLDRPRDGTDPGVHVFDTHNKSALGPWKPDLCICVGGTKSPQESGVYVAVEIKHINNAITDEERGQVLDYLVTMLQLDPSRAMVAGLLSNLHINHVIVLRAVEGGGTQLIQYKTGTLAEVLTFIKQVVLVDLRYCPPESSFPSHLGIMERRLGHPRASAVSEFVMSSPVLLAIKSLWPSEVESLGKCMAVKVLLKRPVKGSSSSESVLVDRTQLHEILVYKLIQSHSSPSKDLARLVYSSPDNRILGTAPVGTRVDIRGISDHNNLRTILNDVLNGLTWLHGIGILHRDIRRDNIIVVSTPGTSKLNGKIIDFGTAIVLNDAEETFRPQVYGGGYICCPREIIGHFKRPYIPRFAHDRLAWVMLVNFLVFPNGVPYLQSNRVAFESVEAERLTAYWDSLSASEVWSRFIEAAEDEDSTDLARLMTELVVMLSG